MYAKKRVVSRSGRAARDPDLQDDPSLPNQVGGFGVNLVITVASRSKLPEARPRIFPAFFADTLAVPKAVFDTLVPATSYK